MILPAELAYADKRPVNNKGYYLSKKKCYLITAALTMFILALVLGLVFGLKDVYSMTEAEKFASCQDLTCGNVSVLQQMNAVCLANRKSNTKTQELKNYRLPTDLVPSYYNIMITALFDSLTEPDEFDGYVNIRFKCVKRTNSIVLHHRNIEVNEATIKVMSAGSMQLNVSSTSYDEETDIYTINLVQSLQDGQEYSISMHYEGHFKANNFGFYKSFYNDAQGRKRWLVTSQMESVEARRGFPCFDEPGMKSQFKLTVVHSKNMQALANMPVERTEPAQGDFVKTEFQVTVPMSTYLVALVISDFECKGEILEGVGEKGSVEVRVCGRADAIASGQLDYSLQIATKVLKFYEEFYGVKYPLPKCDHVAVPDFNAGAMENWGLITYRESILFYDPKTSSQSSQQFTVLVIAHELAHMWFGNLVTTQWWNDLWLNEGFATYVEYVGTDAAEKRFLMFEQYVEEVFDILEEDSVPNSRAISIDEGDVNTPDDIDALFDPISYGKGGCLIRMMNYMMGESTFSNGIRNYLEKYKFSNAIQDNLWAELGKAAKEDKKLIGLDLNDVMNTWTKQMGHPLITIQKVDNNNIRISQEHFLLDTSSKPTEVSPFGYKWYVPFTYSVEKVGAGSNVGSDVNIQNLYNRVEWLRQNENSKVIRLNTPLDGDNGFILANLDVSGFYRVNYDEANWDRIVQQLNNRKDAIPTRNRAQLINDAFGLSQAGIISTTRPFELIRYLSRETEYLPWSTTITRLSYYTNMLDSTSAFGNYEKYVLDLITPLYNRLGWVQQESDSWLDRRLRTRVLSFACARDLGACVSKARSWYSQWMQNESENPIPGSYRGFVYCTAIRQGGEKEWEFASAQYDKEQSASQRSNLQAGMSCTKQPWLISRYLNDQVNASKVRLQDAASGIEFITVKSSANLRAWSFVKENWDELVNKISMGRIVQGVASKFNTKAQLDDFVKFFDEHPNQGSAERDVKSSIDRIKANIRWMSSGYEQLNTWLSTYQNAVPVATPSYRLPTDLSPYHYEVLAAFQFETERDGAFPYDGEVAIHFTCVKDTSNLVLHIDKLVIDNSTLSVKSLTDRSYSEVKAFNWVNDFERHFFIANFSKPFKAGHNYTFSASFVGFLSDDNYGFYRSSYVDSRGVKKWLMTSQFEATSARKAFPCFDEPAFKASFKISAIHQKDYHALSNMPVERIVDVGNNRVRTEFYPTPLMSSYLGALVVSDFVCKYENADSGLNGSIPIGSCGRRNAVDQLDFGLDIGVRIIEYLEQLFEVKFPLPKCDHIAIPDFAAGAMENWGLVTYRQAQYLYNPGVTVPSTEQAIAGTVVHEIVHMWFGDIVSPLWWDDTWLNEGFARYFQYVGTSVVQPKYQMIEQFKNLFFNRLYTDSVATARSVSFDVNTPSQISAIFDSTTYDKGGSILHMVSNFLGNETFVRALVRYLDRYSYGNTDGEMLWNTIDEVVKEEGSKLQNMNLNELMNTWMKQMGHPVVTVKRVDDRTISLSQNHFLLDPTTPPIRESAYNYRWYIPYTHSIERVGSVNADTLGLHSNNLWQKTIWFTPNEDTKTIVFDRPLSDEEFVLANLRASGFYRVNYDNHFWDRIVKQLMRNKDAIPVENRAQFLHDSIAFSEATIIDGEKPFELMEYLSNENEELPWIAFTSRIGYYYNMLVATSAYGNFQSFVRSLIRPLYLKLDWQEKPTDSWIEKLQRTNVVSISCLRGVQECVDKARTYFDNLMSQDRNLIPSNFRSFVYCTAIREGGEKEWNFASDRYLRETDASERNNLLNGMSCTTRTWLVSRFLNDQLSNPRVAEGLAGLRAAAIRPDAILKTWSFVKENWNALFARHGNNIANLLSDFAATFNTQFLLDDFTTFFENNPDQSVLASQIAISRQRIVRNVEWHKKSFKSVDEWLSKKFSSQNKLKTIRIQKTELEASFVADRQDEISYNPLLEVNKY